MTSKFKKKYENAKNSCQTVCIPLTATLKNVVITSEFVDTHILSPSPYLKSHYITTDKKRSKELEIDGTRILLKAGFKENKTIRIVGEECCYNKNFNEFSIFIIEEPLCPVHKTPGKQKQNESYWAEIINDDISHISFSQSEKFLYQLPENKQVLSSLEEQLQHFHQNYLLLPTFLPNAATKLKDMIDSCIQELVNVHKDDVQDNEKIETALTSLVESYVMGRVRSKVFPVICQRFSSEDKGFADKLKDLGAMHVTADQLGIKEVFCCPQPAAVVELASIDTLGTPGEKMNCINNTIDAIEQTVKENQPILRLTSAELPMVTSDDLIPILVTVIIQAKLSHLFSTLFYIEHFRYSNLSSNQESFNLVTLQAAVEYIKNTDFSRLQPRKVEVKKEISLAELMQVTETLQLQEAATKDTLAEDPQCGRQVRVVDRELQKITKMIEASTRELQQAQQLGVPQRKGHQRNSSFGEFLCGTQQDSVCDVAYKRQT